MTLEETKKIVETRIKAGNYTERKLFSVIYEFLNELQERRESEC